MKFQCALLAVFLSCSSTSRTYADDDYVPEDGTTYDSKGGTHGSSENFSLGERALKAHQTEKAILYLRRSVNAKGDDLNARAAYATALEDKYRGQVDKDPDLFKECVSQWYVVLKSVAPEEKGSSIMKVLYKEDERDMPAKVHLKELTGKLPKTFESKDKFLARVTRGHGNVSGSLLKAAPVKRNDLKE